MAIERSGQGHGVGASVPPRRTTGTCAAAVSPGGDAGGWRALAALAPACD
jgi:hypothetical protein